MKSLVENLFCEWVWKENRWRTVRLPGPPDLNPRGRINPPAWNYIANTRRWNASPHWQRSSCLYCSAVGSSSFSSNWTKTHCAHAVIRYNVPKWKGQWSDHQTLITFLQQERKARAPHCCKLTGLNLSLEWQTELKCFVYQIFFLLWWSEIMIIKEK